MLKPGFPLFLLALNLALLAYALLDGLAHGNAQQHFEETELMTYFSSFQLLAMAVFTWVISEREPKMAGISIWTMMALGGLFLAFDEVLMIHENPDFSIHD